MRMGSVISHDEQLHPPLLGLARYGFSRLTCPQQFSGYLLGRSLRNPLCSREDLFSLLVQNLILCLEGVAGGTSTTCRTTSSASMPLDSWTARVIRLSTDSGSRRATISFALTTFASCLMSKILKQTLPAGFKFFSRNVLKFVERFGPLREPRDREGAHPEACGLESLSSHEPDVGLRIIRVRSYVDRKSICGAITENQGPPGFCRLIWR